ncbi:concanavalin A-like lectin/glucanase domain-containing protein [Halteromyces radiatus]|uniref:concanavalin A-like lectin/glucanase domain-containing protein n=1 Tax=Halteromyces radiatus TaxID=101107 RepID=UPI002220D4F1|nr:concanavalin A-like lectin/glucanase domain-containing protein [Halteromyces radiatus]KAI8097607.1 concanavalin A-like lectin/glucanase domain-containing protein [Halteromyces radiatus]
MKIIMTFFFLFLTLPLLLQAQLDNSCDCGYYDPNDNQYSIWTSKWEMDFEGKSSVTQGSPKLLNQLEQDFFRANYEIGAKWVNSFGRIFTKDNVQIQNGVLQLSVTVNNNNNNNNNNNSIRCSAIGTKRQDILYGSFRSLMRLTPENGTVQAMYFFHPEGEIDIEVLGAVAPPQSYFAIHPGLREPNGRASALTHDNHFLNFDPSIDFHEYRFDWFPDRAEFYIDGALAQTLVTNIPNAPGRFMFSHWTDGNPTFSKGPPVRDAITEIKSVVALFNTSSFSPLSCQSTQMPCAIQGTRKDQPSSSPSAIVGLPPSSSESSKTMDAYLFVILFLIGCTILLQ